VIAGLLFSCVSCDREQPAEQASHKEKIMEIQNKMARYSPTEVTFDASLLSEAQKGVVKKLVEAADLLDRIFWKQASHEGPVLREKLAASEDPLDKVILEYLEINYGPYDRLDENENFYGTEEKPLGAGYYPADMTKEEFNQWIEAHPEDREAFESLFTVIERRDGGLAAVPYSEAYREELEEAARLLREAAALAENPSLKKFLTSRAEAFLTDDYFQSDCDWMDLKDHMIEVVIGPYEVYEDKLFNYKAAFEAFICLKDPEESVKLERIVGYLPALEQNLPIPDHHKNPDRGAESPMSVVQEIYTAGDTRAGVQTVAFNLPNDENVREQKGSKKVMLKNIQQAKFDKILVPISKILLEADQWDYVTFEAYFNQILLHEISHGLGPGKITMPDGRETLVNKELKELYSAIEEAKADVCGMYNLFYLIKEGLYPETLRKTVPVSFLAGLFRSMRFGVDEAHGKANVVQMNYLLKEGAISVDPESGKFTVHFDRIEEAITSLARILLTLEAEGDYEGSRQFLEAYGQVTPVILESLDKLKDLPTDIRPIYTVKDVL
jgi:hypothetical protein